MQTRKRVYPNRTPALTDITPEELAIIGSASWSHVSHYCNCHDDPDPSDLDDGEEMPIPGDYYMTSYCEQARTRSINHQQHRLNQLRTYVNAKVTEAALSH